MAETSTASRQVPQDHPLMIAWEAYKKRQRYGQIREWAQQEAHVDGALWAAFEQGFRAASLMPHPNPPGGPEANPAGEALYRAAVERSQAEFPEEREAQSLGDVVRFIERWMPESLPANEHGQISFGRSLLEMALDAMKASLAAKEA